MQTYTPTTPFGRRSLSHGQIMGQRATADVAPEAVVHKWHVFNDIREAREQLGLTDRALAILNALLTFHPETTLGASGDLIVFPSNNQLMARAYGISPRRSGGICRTSSSAASSSGATVRMASAMRARTTTARSRRLSASI